MNRSTSNDQGNQLIVAMVFAGTADEWRQYGSRVLRKAAMRGDNLRNAAHRARLRAEFQQARRRYRVARLSQGRGGDVA